MVDYILYSLLLLVLICYNYLTKHSGRCQGDAIKIKHGEKLCHKKCGRAVFMTENQNQFRFCVVSLYIYEYQLILLSIEKYRSSSIYT